MPRKGVDEWIWTVKDLQRLQGELHRSRPVVATGKCWEPRIDLIETSHSLVIKAEIAGARAEDIQIVYVPERHSILIQGQREDDGAHPSRRFHQMEIPSGEFGREIALPELPIDAQNMKAQYRNGFLVVMIPKLGSVIVTQTVTIEGL